MTAQDPSAARTEMLDRWERGADGWRRRADDIRDFGGAVSDWLIEELDLRPGQRVLELAAGPGDTGFMAAQRVSPGGTLICSDASEAMLAVARERAAALGLDNVEFLQLQLEWIDLETASVQAALCRWALMLLVDPAAALQEIRRVLRPGGRFATAVWDLAEHNPWATIPTRALVELGHAEPPDRDAPGMFALADSGRLRQLMESAGFIEVQLDTVKLDRPRPSLDGYLAEQLDLSLGFSETRQRLDDKQWEEVRGRIAELAERFTAPDGSVTFPARCLLASAST
jgi:SAM-dependent methyltransferase